MFFFNKKKTGILNNIQTGAISDLAPNSFVPGKTHANFFFLFSNLFSFVSKKAGWAFSIWSLIYIALALYVIYTLLPWNRGNDIIVNKIGLLLPFNFMMVS